MSQSDVERKRRAPEIEVLQVCATLILLLLGAIAIPLGLTFIGWYEGSSKRIPKSVSPDPATADLA